MKTVSTFHTLVGYSRNSAMVRLRAKVTYYPHKGTYTIYLFDGRAKMCQELQSLIFHLEGESQPIAILGGENPIRLVVL